jgi:hypothetical protein
MGDYQYRVPPLNASVGKFVQITVTGCSNGGGYASINEIGVYGVPATMVAPTVATGPVSQSVAADQAVTLSVSPTGEAPFTYQWMLNNIVISGGTNSTYTIASAAAGNMGTYSVIVTDAAGSGTFNISTLTLAPSVPTLPVWASVTLILVLFVWGQHSLRKHPVQGDS